MNTYTDDLQGHKQFIDDVVMTVADKVQRKKQEDPEAKGLLFDMQEHVGIFGMSFGEDSKVLSEELSVAQLHPGHAPEIHLVLKMGDKSLLHLVNDEEGYAMFEHVDTDGTVTKRVRLGVEQMGKLMELLVSLD